MTENLIHWSDEAQLLGYGESDSTGAWLKFRVNPEDLEEFRGLKGTVFYLTVIQMDAEGKPVARTAAVDAPVEPEKPAQPAHEYGQQASDLYRNGFFLVPDVLRAMNEVSEKTGISRATLTRIANVPGYNTNTDTIDALCKYFGCTLSELLVFMPDGG